MMFHSPFFLVLLLPAALIVFYTGRKKTAAGFKFSSAGLLSGLQTTFKAKLSRGLIFLRLASVSLVIIALARPQAPVADSRVQSEGIDIVLAVDCSTSMLAEDFQIAGRRQSRIDVIKDVVKDFIKGRSNDRIGIVAFAGRAYTVCPLTLDYGWLLENLDRIKAGMIEDGTAIGSGSSSALNRLRSTKTKSKIVILLTDGRNNTGKVAPLVAAEAAKALKVKVYTIGAGTKGLAPYPVRDFFGNVFYEQVRIDLDEDTLAKIALITDARYFRATDTESLKEIYRQIDKMEKTPVEEKGYSEYNELFPLLLIPGLALLFLEIALANTVLRKVP